MIGRGIEGALHQRGQVAFEATLLASLVGVVLFLPWRGGNSIAEQLFDALSGFMSATLIAIAIL